MAALTGFFGGMVESVVELVAACTAFQTWVGAEDEEAAAGRVHRLVALGDATVWPCVQVTYGNGMQLNRISSQGFSPRSGGMVALAFEGLAGSERDTDPEADQVAFANAVEGIVAEMVSKSAPGDDYVQLMGIGPEGPFGAFGVVVPRRAGDEEVVVYRWVWWVRLP